MKPKRTLLLLVLLLVLAGLSLQPVVGGATTKSRVSLLPARLDPGGIQASITLDAVADATVYNTTPGSNYGGDDTLTISYANIDTVQQAVSLVKFDLTSLPTGAIIDSAQLQLYLTGSAGASPVSIATFFVTGGWSEYGVTWNSFPTANPVGINASIDAGAGYKSWVITSYAQSWLEGVNNGVYLNWFEEVRTRYVVDRIGRMAAGEVSFIMASATLNFRSPVQLLEVVDLYCGPVRVGTKSWELAYEFRARSDGRLVCDGSSVQVQYDYGARCSVPLADDWRRPFEEDMPK
jgi:acyl-CoA thioesterase FadM